MTSHLAKNITQTAGVTNIVLNNVFKLIPNQATMRKNKSLYDRDLIKFDSISGEIKCTSKIDALNFEVGSLKSEVGSWKSEVGSWKSEVGRRKSEVGSRKSEVGSGKSEVPSRLSYKTYLAISREKNWQKNRGVKLCKLQADNSGSHTDI